MKKGFTLIELLAVIVILAIIALIATPIILGIINDARKESNERSAELYASAVKNAIASYQLTHPNAPTTFDDLDVKYDGNVVCETEELYVDGTFYIADCTANGNAVEYTYGDQQVTQPTRYYSWDLSGTVEETAAPANPSIVPPTGKNVYLGYEVTDGVVSTVYVCFTRNEAEYCLKGHDAEVYATNIEVLTEAFGEDNCSFEPLYTVCNVDSFHASANVNRDVSAYGIRSECNVYSDGHFECQEW